MKKYVVSSKTTYEYKIGEVTEHGEIKHLDDLYTHSELDGEKIDALIAMYSETAIVYMVKEQTKFYRMPEYDFFLLAEEFDVYQPDEEAEQ
jgi:hypothetical protein